MRYRTIIHYHVTPMGGPRQDAARFIQGRHVLVPYARREDMGPAGEFAQSFIFDNSAYTVWEGGGVLDVEGYTRWCDEYSRHPSLDWCLIPDAIDAGEAENDALLRDWPERLRHIGVPVWHMDESLERLDRLIKAGWRTIAFGSAGAWKNPGSRPWWGRMGEVMAVACDTEGKPRTRYHGLRMLNVEIFTKLPLSSADSVNAAMNAGSLDRFGNYVPATTSQRAAVIAGRIEAFNSAAVWVPQTVQMELL